MNEMANQIYLTKSRIPYGLFTSKLLEISYFTNCSTIPTYEMRNDTMILVNQSEESPHLRIFTY